MKLNLGCGRNLMVGYENVDKIGTPDLIHDLESIPWPWRDDSIEEVRANHVLEHLGKDADTFIAIMKELYRVCRQGARIFLVVPHPRHDNFLSDPTHVRPVTPLLLQLFSQRMNRIWIEQRYANSTLAIDHHVDFELRAVGFMLEQYYQEELAAGRITDAELRRMMLERNNIASEYHFELEVIKPLGASAG